MQYITENDGTVRILSFQSHDVLDNFIKNNYYEASSELKREYRDYKLDIEQLGGYNPVWGFALPIKDDVEFIYGGMLERFRCEMSLSKSTLADFVCLELFVPKELVKLGLTYNDSKNVVVFPYIKKDFLHRVYQVEIIHLTMDGYKFKMPRVNTVKVFNDSNVATFEDGFRSLAMEEFDLLKIPLTEKFPYRRVPVEGRVSYVDNSVKLKNSAKISQDIWV